MVLRPEEVDGPAVMHHLMNKQPILWGSILNTTSCPSIVQLIKLAKAMESNLIAQYYNGLQVMKAKSAHMVGVISPEKSDLSEGEAGPSNLKEAHIIAKGGCKKHTDWTKGRTIAGYCYNQDDSVVSKVAPPGPCFICLSPKHFFRDCPHNMRFFRKSAHSAELIINQDKLVEMDLEYYNLVSAANETSDNYVLSKSESLLTHNNDLKPRDQRNRNERRREMFEMWSKKKGKQKAEEVPKENRALCHQKLKLKKACVFTTSLHPEDDPRDIAKTQDKNLFSDEEENNDSFKPLPSSSAHQAESHKVTMAKELDPDAPPLNWAKNEETVEEAEVLDWTPNDSEVTMAIRKEMKPEGLGSLGCQVLHFKGHVQSIGRGEVKPRLDSSADITLMSKEFWNKIGTLMKPKEGIQMKLYHLTGHATVLGYVKT